jgi:hypothetical protein
MILSTHGVIASQIQSFVGLLDLYPSAAVAYSVRKLRLAYTGSAIRVRRSSDNAEQDIGFSSGNLDTTALTTFCSGTDGFVTTWYDQSGNGANATQTTASNQPVIVTAGVVNIVNSKPAVYFNNGNTTQLNFSSISLSDFTILWVSKKASATTSQSIILRGTGSDYAGDDVDGTGLPNLYVSNALVIGTSLSNTSPSSNLKLNQHLAYLNRRNSNEAVGQFNNSNNSYNNGVSSSNFPINGIANYGSNYNYVGDLQEIIIYANDQSANRTGISTEINTYYAIY